MLRFVAAWLHVHTGRCEVWGMQMSVVIVTGLTLSLIRDSGAEVVTGPGWETQRQRTGNRQQRHLSQPGRRNVGKWGSIFGHFELLSEVGVLILCSFCMMSVMAWWWGPGWCYDDSVLPLSHLVVTNKSNKNPQLIRSDSVQNRFFSPLADRVGADL